MIDPADLKIGSIVWKFDPNHREYEKQKDGKRNLSSPIIYRSHFRPMQIDGETSTTWLVNGGRKAYSGGSIPKNHLSRRGAHGERNFTVHAGFYLTEQAVDDAVFDHHERPYISAMVGRESEVSVTKLRQIAELIGYEERG